MTYFKHIIGSFALLIYRLIPLALLTFTACSSDSMEPNPDGKEAPGYLNLTVSIAGNEGSRANPTGGEEGDGSEQGRAEENSIKNLSIFLYVDGGEGLDGEYEFKWKKYVDNLIGKEINPNQYIYSIPLTQDEVNGLKAPLVGGIMRLAVIANAGDITTLHSNTKSLVLDRTYTSAWKGTNPVDANNFLMAPAYNGAKKAGDDGHVTKPTTTTSESILYNAEVSLERVAARIDLKVTTDNIKDNTIRYNVSGTDNYLTLKNAIPVNLMQTPSYLVKQVASDNTDKWLSAGDETKDERGYPTNYVITPDFNKSNSPNLDNWFKDSKAASLRVKTNDELKNISLLSSDVIGSAYKYDDASDKERTIILTYANENTHPKKLQLTHESDDATYHPSDYLTGLLFRAQYHPAVVYSDGACTQTRDYVDEEDFWLFRPVGSEIMEKNNRYFISEEALNAYIATLPAGGKYETQKYTGGVCYYNVWIKHANVEDNPEENFPMKYGIVRNNIYRISLSFSGIGHPTPVITEPYAVTSRVFVIKWNFRPQPEIIM